MTAAEISAMQDAAAKAEAEEKRRQLSLGEVQEMMVLAQINTLSVDDTTALRMVELYPEWADLIGKTVDKAGFSFTHGGKLYKTIPANQPSRRTGCRCRHGEPVHPHRRAARRDKIRPNPVQRK